MRSPAGLEEEARDKWMDGQTDDKWLSKDWEQSQAREMWQANLAGRVLTALRDRG